MSAQRNALFSSNILNIAEPENASFVGRKPPVYLDETVRMPNQALLNRNCVTDTHAQAVDLATASESYENGE